MTPNEPAGPGILGSVWQYRWLVAAVTLVALVGGYLYANRAETRYTASTRIYLTDPRTAGVFRSERGSFFVEINRYLQNQASRMTSTPVVQRAAEHLDGEVSPGEIRASLGASPAEDRDLVTVRATHHDPQTAAAIANAVAQAYDEVAAETVISDAARAVEELTAARDDLEARVQELEAALDESPENEALISQYQAATDRVVAVEARADQVRVDAALYGSGVDLIEPASPPRSPSHPQPRRTALAAGGGALLLSAAFAFWRAGSRRPEIDERGVADILGAPQLASVPEFRRARVDGPVPTATAPRSIVAEAFHSAAASLEFLSSDRPVRSILVTSAIPGEGKTTTAANLGVAFRQAGRGVVLVDADERHQGATRLFGAVGRQGLADLLRADSHSPVDLCVINTDVAGSLPLLPAGVPDERATGALDVERFRTVVMRDLSVFDVVVIDSPPALAVADTVRLAKLVDGVVVVVADGTPTAAVEDLRRRLDLAGCSAVGYIFNRAEPAGGVYGYGYGSDATPVATHGNGSAAAVRMPTS